MQIQIPKEAEAHLKSLAAEAGFGKDVQQYVLHRSLGSDLDEEKLEALRNDPRIARLIEEGLASGNAGPMTDQDWSDIKERLEQRIVRRS